MDRASAEEITAHLIRTRTEEEIERRRYASVVPFVITIVPGVLTLEWVSRKEGGGEDER